MYIYTILKAFVRSHDEFFYTIYDQPNNEIFCNLNKKVQYNAGVALHKYPYSLRMRENTGQKKLHRHFHKL